MKVNDVLRKGDSVLRVLVIRNNQCFCIDCSAGCMPVWMPADTLEAYIPENVPKIDISMTVRQKQTARL